MEQKKGLLRKPHRILIKCFVHRTMQLVAPFTLALQDKKKIKAQSSKMSIYMNSMQCRLHVPKNVLHLAGGNMEHFLQEEGFAAGEFKVSTSKEKINICCSSHLQVNNHSLRTACNIIVSEKKLMFLIAKDQSVVVPHTFHSRLELFYHFDQSSRKRSFFFSSLAHSGINF